MQPDHRSPPLSSASLELPQPIGLLKPGDHLLDSLAGCDRLGVGLVASGKGVADPSTCFDGFEGLVGLAKSLRSW